MQAETSVLRFTIGSFASRSSPNGYVQRAVRR